MTHITQYPDYFDYQAVEPNVQVWWYFGVSLLGAILGIIIVTLAVRSIMYLLKMWRKRRDRTYCDTIQHKVEQDLELGQEEAVALEDMLAPELKQDVLTEDELKTLNEVYSEIVIERKHLMQQKYEAMQTLQRVDAQRVHNFQKLQDMYDHYTAPHELQ